jgi:hypothetical protein
MRRATTGGEPTRLGKNNADNHEVGGVSKNGTNGTNQDPAIRFVTRRVKLLAELTAADVPPGIDPEDVAVDCDRR